jgi:Protein of unknown function (DUF2946)
MLFLRVYRRFTAALALLAMVLSVLAPTVAQAVVNASGQAQWVEVCSASGMVWVNVSGSAEPGAQSEAPNNPMGDMSEPCLWCTLHGGVAGAPAKPLAFVGPVLGAEPAPAFLFSATVTGVWAVAHARAPPAAA